MFLFRAAFRHGARASGIPLLRALMLEVDFMRVGDSGPIIRVFQICIGFRDFSFFST